MLLTILRWVNAFADSFLINLNAFVRLNPGALTATFLVLALVTLPLFLAGFSRPQSACPPRALHSTAFHAQLSARQWRGRGTAPGQPPAASHWTPPVGGSPARRLGGSHSIETTPAHGPATRSRANRARTTRRHAQSRGSRRCVG